MITIYLDKQVFSHLFKCTDEKYKILREKILSHKDDFIFMYSNSHLLDLQQDKTDIKYKEMEFMQSIVNGHHLIYDGRKIQVELSYPSSAFEKIEDVNDISRYDSIDYDNLTKDQISIINNIIDLTNKDRSGQLEFDWLSQREPIDMDRPIVPKEHFSSLMKSLDQLYYGNKQTYRIVRDNTVAQYNPQLICTDGELSFNTEFSEAPLRLPFIDLVKAAIKQIGISDIDDATFYYFSYMLLDLFGICKEQRGKAKIANVRTDGFHSFFGTYCDCIVSDDEGMRNKSKALYKLFNVEADVYSIDEFIEAFDKAISDLQNPPQESIDEIMKDYFYRQVADIRQLEQIEATHIKTFHKYFGYFSYMNELKTENGKIIILQKKQYLAQSLLTTEIKVIVNRFAKSLNKLGFNIQLFDEEKEKQQLVNGEWGGRIVEFQDGIMGLSTFPDTPMLYCWIALKDGNIHTSTN